MATYTLIGQYQKDPVHRICAIHIPDDLRFETITRLREAGWHDLSWTNTSQTAPVYELVPPTKPPPTKRKGNRFARGSSE